jgi:hypothetical protein
VCARAGLRQNAVERPAGDRGRFGEGPAFGPLGYADFVIPTTFSPRGVNAERLASYIRAQIAESNPREIRDAFAVDDYQILLVDVRGPPASRDSSGTNAITRQGHHLVLDFVNSSEEVLAAFKIHCDTAALESVTDPNLVYDLRAKLDASGHYPPS